MTVTSNATPSPAHLRSLYRSFLRELPPRPILSSSRPPTHKYIRQTFSQSPAPPSSSSSSSAPTTTSSSTPSPQHAEQFIAYLKSQRMYATLLERYNPGMDMEDEERIRLTAKRVGMEMPLAYKKGAA